MADSVSTQIIVNNERNLVMKFTNLSDGTGETNVVKVNASTLGLTSHLTIWRVSYDIRAGGLRIIWGGATPTDAVILSDNSGALIDMQCYGGIWNNATTPNGNILFTTVAFAANSSYTIVLEMKKNA